jgi:hypothetical protein
MSGIHKTGLLLLMVVSAAAGSASAREIYRTTDPDGVVSFSDTVSPGAEVLHIEAAPVSESTRARQQQMIDQQLAVAKSLEASRLAREAARTERLKALAAAQPRTVFYQQPETRYVGSVYRKRWPWHPGYPGHPGVRPPYPVHPIAPPPGGGSGHGGSRLDPPSRTVPLPPLKSRQN